MNSNDNQPVLPEGVTMTGEGKNRIYQHGKTTFRSHGRKWHFTCGTFTFIAHLPNTGGVKTAARIAPLVEKDVLKTGRIGSQRPNIERLIEYATVA